jgi:hypothetical protein
MPQTQTNKQASYESTEDYILERKPGSFRGTHTRRTIILAQFIPCCCCCWHIIGAYIGAYIGGVIGSGIGYKQLQRKTEIIPKYRWLFLWSLLGTGGFIGSLFILDYCTDLLDWLGWPVLVVITIWTLGINPCLCFLAAKRFSWRLLWISLSISLPLAAIGFCIGWVVLKYN